MKIMHVEAGKHLYGGALQVFYLMRGLHQRGCKNILVCPVDSDIGKQSTDIAHVEQVKMAGDLDIGFCLRLKRLIEAHKPDILHIHSRRGADHFGGIAARWTKTPSILTRRVDNTELRLAAKVKAWCFDELVAISEGIRQVQIGLGVKPEKIRTIHSAVDTDKYQPRNIEQADILRDRFQLPPDALTIGVIAQLIERKGHRFLFDIVSQLIEEFPSLQVLVFGKGPEEAQLKHYVEHLNLQQTIHFAGFHSDMENLIPSMDLVVHPALKEGLGVALLQASACGIPMVACGVGGIPEIVQHEKNGYIVPPADSQALLSSIQTLLRSDDHRQAFSRQGRAIAETEFSITAMVEGNFNRYKALLAKSV
ncbi:Putative glycosyltransferase EpsD [Thalassocella blandensis]|nr:Putative glycosyltransferase EpsD [Thalassocella blandensis]